MAFAALIICILEKLTSLFVNVTLLNPNRSVEKLEAAFVAALIVCVPEKLLFLKRWKLCVVLKSRICRGSKGV